MTQTVTWEKGREFGESFSVDDRDGEFLGEFGTDFVPSEKNSPAGIEFWAFGGKDTNAHGVLFIAPGLREVFVKPASVKKVFEAAPGLMYRLSAATFDIDLEIKEVACREGVIERLVVECQASADLGKA
jgi:hypothetical protein